jgi:hypothetical protein
MIEEVSTDHNFYNDTEALVDYFESQISCYGTSYKIIRVKGEGYTNSLILNNKVFVPLFGSEWDDEAIATYEAAMQGYEILGFSHDDFSWGNAIHCRTKGIPDRYMLYIEHVPLWKNQIYTDDGFEVQAKIFPYSGESLITDSTLLYWRLKDEEWNTLQMQSIGDDYYSATIPPQNLDVTIEYYIHAEDESGRIENHPYIGAPMAYNFTVNNPPEKPSIEGPANGKPGNEYTYTASTVDPDDDQVYYWFNWGDDTNTGWIGPYPSGETVIVMHTWSEKGTYTIRGKAKDKNDIESDWAELTVTMPRYKVIQNTMFQWFLEKFPILHWLFQRLI